MNKTVKPPDILRHISVDCVIFGYGDGKLHVLLRRESIEHDGVTTIEWKLPGHHMLIDETAEETAIRTLREQTGMGNIFMKQFRVFSSLDRLHRREFDFEWIRTHGVGEWRVVTVGFYAAVNLSAIDLGGLSPEAEWKEISTIGELIFDHREILDAALAKLRDDLAVEPVIFELLPDKFTLSELQQLYEIIIGRPVDKRNFRRKAITKKYLAPLAERQTGVAHRAATYYLFNRKVFDKETKEHLLF